MSNSQDIILTVDYHDEHCVVRWFDAATQKSSVQRIETEALALRRLMRDAVQTAQGRGGQAVWIQESTTGWARVQELASQLPIRFLLANVLQMPLPPKARRRKTDKVDTARLQREYLNGELPLAHQPSAKWRQVRRLVSLRENLTSRRTALTNWINRYLAHETWNARKRFTGATSLEYLRTMSLPAMDRRLIDWKLAELEQLETRLHEVEQAVLDVYKQWPEAHRLDAIRGVGPIGAVSILARIGPIDRFQGPEQLIAFAGLAPGIRQSDGTRRDGKIGGGGTDKHLRHYLIEATVWAREIPRYQATYERAARKRGKKIGRLVVARLLIRSIYKMLRDGVAFEPEAAAPLCMT
jgi:transposase